MKKLYLLYILSFSSFKFSSAQILCIFCYDQNDSISDNVNNLLLNGGLEDGCAIPAYFCPNATNYGCDVTNWTCIGGGSNTYAIMIDNSFSIIPEGARAAYFGNALCCACVMALGDTSCINNTNCSVAGVPVGYPVNPTSGFGGATGVSLEQTVTGLIVGNTYVLEFWAGGEGYSIYVNRGLFAVNVGFGDTLLRDNPTPPLTGIGTRYIIEFNATSSSHIIKFTNWGHICGSCTELVLDDIRLYTLSELDAFVPHCTVGTDFPNSENLQNPVSPNPFTNELTIKTNNRELSEIIFYDIASRKLLQQTFINSATVNTENFSKGIYFYEIKNQEGVVKKGKTVKN